MSLTFIDKYERAPTGHFVLRAYRKGELVEVIDEPNLIVVGSQLIHAKLLGGAVTNQSVTQIGFGTNPTAPAFGNTALTGAYVKAVDTVSYPASNQVQFAFSLGTGEANGLAIAEFGLLTPTSALYARKTRSAPLNKDTDLTFSGSWTISF